MAKTTYRVRVADITRYEAGEPIRRVTLPEVAFTAAEVAAAVARGASVTCLVCEEPWDWCSHLLAAVEARLPRERAQLVAAFEAAGLPVPPVCRSRPEEPEGLVHQDGLVVLAG